MAVESATIRELTRRLSSQIATYEFRLGKLDIAAKMLTQSDTKLSQALKLFSVDTSPMGRGNVEMKIAAMHLLKYLDEILFMEGVSFFLLRIQRWFFIPQRPWN
jgi:hypothetical protein